MVLDSLITSNCSRMIRRLAMKETILTEIRRLAPQMAWDEVYAINPEWFERMIERGTAEKPRLDRHALRRRSSRRLRYHSLWPEPALSRFADSILQAYGL